MHSRTGVAGAPGYKPGEAGHPAHARPMRTGNRMRAHRRPTTHAPHRDAQRVPVPCA